MRKVRPYILGPERPGILTIRKYPSHRITGVGYTRWAPRPANFSTSNAKGSSPPPGLRIRTCEWDPNVPSPTSIPHVRLFRAKFMRASPGARPRSGCNDNASDRRCPSYEASRSVHEAISPKEPRGEQRFDDGQEVPLVSTLLMTPSLPATSVQSLFMHFHLRFLSPPTCFLSHT